MRAGVSRTVVSFVLNNRPHTGIPEETRERVLRAAAELHYHPNRAAQSLVKGRTGTIAVVVSESRHDAYGDAFLPALLRSVEGSARAEGYHVVLHYLGEASTDDDPDVRRLDLLRAGGFDGFLVCGPRQNDRVLAMLLESGVPSITIGHPGALICPSVDIDNSAAARRAVEHLLGHGYRRIALVTNAPLAFVSSQDRSVGYRQALAEANVPFEEALVAEAGLDDGAGQRAISEILSHGERPDAVFAASDQVALGVLAGLQRVGLKVPTDIALVGFDDLPLATQVHPTLTTIHVPIDDLGRVAAKHLVDLINGRGPEADRFLLPTGLQLRESCGPHVSGIVLQGGAPIHKT